MGSIRSNRARLAAMGAAVVTMAGATVLGSTPSRAATAISTSMNTETVMTSTLPPSTVPPSTVPPATESPPAESPSSPTEPATVAGPDFDVVFVDDSRPTPAVGGDPGSSSRTLLTAIYLPATTEPAPLVVLAHGYDGHPRKFTALARAWADAGFVVAVPRFPVSADDAAGAGGEFADRVADVGQQALDVSFVIDEVIAANDTPDHPLDNRADPDHIGLFGLSLGSMTVWAALVGPDASEDRIDAVIQSDGIGPSSPWDGPVLIAHSDADTVLGYDAAVAGLCSTPGEAALLTLHGAAHAAVGENTPTPADEAYRAATTTFWRRYLAGDESATYPPTLTVPGVTTFQLAADACANGLPLPPTT